MSIKFKILSLLSIILLISMLLGYLFVSYETSSMIYRDNKRVKDEMLLKWQAESKGLITRYYKLLEIYKNIALSEASHFVSDKVVLRAYDLANQGNLEDSNDVKCAEAREILKETVGSTIEGLQDHTGIEYYKLHFHTKNGRSLARTWRKGWQVYLDGSKANISDELTSFRQMIRKIGKTHKKVTGIEIGREGFYVRGICPIKSKSEEYLGSVEFLLPLRDVFKGLVHGNKINYAVYMPYQFLNVAAKLRDSEKYPVLDNKFVRVTTTNGSLYDNLVTEDVIKLINTGGYRIIGDNYFTGLQIKDFGGAVVGTLIISLNISEDMAEMQATLQSIYSEQRSFKTIYVFGNIALFIIVTGMLYTFISRIINRLEITSKELKLSEANYRGLFTHMLDGFALHEIILDDKGEAVDYRFLMINPAFEQQTGMKGDNLIGKTVLEVLPGTEAYWIKKYGDVALTQEPIMFENYAKELNKYFYVYAFSPSKGLFAVVCEDITDRRLREFEKEKMQEDILYSEKMRVVGQLAGGVAHDFNNLLGGIIGNAEVLGSKVDSKQKVYIDRIIDAGDRASDLANKLLAFGHKNFVPHRVVDVVAVLKDSCRILSDKISTAISIAEHYNVKNGIINGDRTQLLSAFINIGLNSSQAMEQGRITVKASNIILSDEDIYGNGSDIVSGEYIRIEISDTGNGIAEDNLNKIFEPFFTTKEVGTGSGLGLAAVLGTVQAHKGSIDVSSVLGKGTSVVIMLPCNSS